MNTRLRHGRSILFSLALIAAGLTAAEVSAADLSGSWSGRWDSLSTGHTGPLNANFTRINESQYQVDFRGRFFKLIPFRYSVVLNVVEEGETVRLSGDNYLGRRYGWFHYDAVVAGDCFTANYTS
ncbi:MAG TPA: hypothetical protein VMP01_19070, partial [Pirellulaceae bacterium]|nr:hypothetical protein [Pirellulaceae bacterium]